MLIGKKIKDLREAKKISLTELSKKTGIQLATLSRIENLKMTGTIESHMKIAEVLGMSLPDLYQNISKDEKKVDIQNTKTASDIFVHSEKSSYEILASKVLSKKMMPILLRIESKGQTNPEQNPTGTEKFLFVLEGTIDVHLDKETFSLSKNHSMYFEASQKHWFSNSGEITTKCICVITPVAL